MSPEDVLKYGTGLWTWLTERPLWLIIGGCVMLGVGIYYSVRPITKAIVVNGPREGGAPAVEALLRDPFFEWEGDKLLLRGRYARGGASLNVYVTYGIIQLGTPRRDVPHSINSSTPAAVAPRVKIDTISRFDRGERAQFALGSIRGMGSDQQALRWGRPEFTQPEVAVTWGSLIGCVVLIEQDASEHLIPFAIFARSVEGLTLPPMVVGPQIISSCPPWLL